MKIINDSKENVKVFGKTFTSLEYSLIIFGFMGFLAIPWPLLSQSYFFIPVGVCLLPCFLPTFVYNEIIKSNSIFNFLLYAGLFVTTFVYTFFFLEASFFTKALHYLVYFTFGYVFSQSKQELKE